MLHLILGNSPVGVAVGEALNWLKPVEQPHFELICGCAREDCRRWDFIRKVDESQFHRVVAIHACIRFAVDSSKEISWLIDSRRWADRSGTIAINTFVWKDPMELAYPFRKRGVGGLMLWRSQFLKYYERVFEPGLPIATINLRGVVRDAPARVGGLPRAVGMEYIEGMERFLEHDDHHLFGKFGLNRQIQIGEFHFQTANCLRDVQSPITQLGGEIGQGDQVRQLVEEFRRLDASRTQSVHEMEDTQRVHLSHPFPLWYYAQKAKWRPVKDRES